MSRKNILTMNDRNFTYVSQNSIDAMRLADDKLATKNLMLENNISTPDLYQVFKNRNDLLNYDFWKIPDDFVLKPNAWLWWEWIMVIVARKDKNTFISASGKEITISEIKNHIVETLEGWFSINGGSDLCLMEKRLILDPMFHDICYKWIPDIRVIVYKNIPVMAMVRLPTKMSEWKANLHLWWVWAWIDIVTGITNHAVMLWKQIEINPDTSNPVTWVQIPHWEKVLETAVRSQQVSGISYLWADIVIDKELWPVILELNARPWLAIQISNMEPLKSRLLKVENENPKDFQEAINIAKNYFNK